MQQKHRHWMATFNPQVMKGTSHFHHQIWKAVFCIAEDIFHNSTSFDTCNRIFDTDPCSRKDTIQTAICLGQFLAIRFFLAGMWSHLAAHILENQYLYLMWNILDMRLDGHQPLSYRGFCQPRLGWDTTLSSYDCCSTKNSCLYEFSSCHCSVRAVFRRLSVPSIKKSGSASVTNGLSATASPSRSGVKPISANVCFKIGRSRWIQKFACGWLIPNCNLSTSSIGYVFW